MGSECEGDGRNSSSDDWQQVLPSSGSVILSSREGQLSWEGGDPSTCDSGSGVALRLLSHSMSVAVGEMGVVAVTESGVVVMMKWMVKCWVVWLGFLCAFVSWSADIFWWKSSIRWSALMWVKGSQLSCASENPFHLMSYWSWLRHRLAPKICSTSHSSYPLTRSGGGFRKLFPCSWFSWYGVKGWMCQGPSHGGFYMDEGTSHIRIGLSPRVGSGDCLASVSHSMPPLFFAHACPMSDDTGLY